MFLLIIECQQTIARIVAFPAIRAGNKTADVHSAVIVIRRNRKACPATARDQEHPQTANRIVLHCASLHRNQLHFNQQPKWLVRNARVVTGLCPSSPQGGFILPPWPASPSSSVGSIAKPSSSTATPSE